MSLYTQHVNKAAVTGEVTAVPSSYNMTALWMREL